VWSFAAVPIRNAPLMASMASGVISRISDFLAQSLANTAWSYAVQQVYDKPLMDSIAACALRIIGEASPTSCSQRQTCSSVLDAIGLAWALEFLLCLDGGLFAAIRDLCLRCGRHIDGIIFRDAGADSVAGVPPRAPALVQVAPTILTHLPGMLVVFKPPGWEVDGHASLRGVGAEGHDGRLGLSSFLQSRFDRGACPLCYWSSFDFGFLHRLDIPSSGLVLVGSTMEGYWSLRLQLNTYRLAREYVVVCQGLVPGQLSKISLGIGSAASMVGKSIVDECGRPAETHVKVLVHLSFPWSCSVSTSLAAIRIRTGRHHQIRTHMLNADCPIVTDGKYTLRTLFLQT